MFMTFWKCAPVNVHYKKYRIYSWTTGIHIAWIGRWLYKFFFDFLLFTRLYETWMYIDYCKFILMKSHSMSDRKTLRSVIWAATEFEWLGVVSEMEWEASRLFGSGYQECRYPKRLHWAMALLHTISNNILNISIFSWDAVLSILNIIFPKKAIGKVTPKSHGFDGKWPEYVQRKEGDSRCSCPALNALANHGKYKHSIHHCILILMIRYPSTRWQKH